MSRRLMLIRLLQLLKIVFSNYLGNLIFRQNCIEISPEIHVIYIGGFKKDISYRQSFVTRYWDDILCNCFTVYHLKPCVHFRTEQPFCSSYPEIQIPSYVVNIKRVIEWFERDHVFNIRRNNLNIFASFKNENI